MRYRWLILASAFLLAISLFTVGSDWYNFFYHPMIEKNSTNQPVIIRVKKASSAWSVVHTLQSKQLIGSERPLLTYIRFYHLAHQFKAGIYQIQAGESAHQFLTRVVAGDVLIQSFRIQEGATQAQINSQLQQAPFLTYNETDWLPIIGSHLNAEGLLLADTYAYPAGSESRVVLQRAHSDLERYLMQQWRTRTPGLPYQSPYALLIAASIIEKESGKSVEKRLIAGVLINRLRQHMPLQMDPTVIYALGAAYDGHLTHAAMMINSPYNSYRFRGLPPTPIGMVGKDAIDAAAHPTPTTYLYFVAKGDGTHQFSTTYDDQKKAISDYLKKELP